MVNEILVYSSSGTTKLSIIANLSAGQLPYHFLKASAKWEPFWCPEDSILGSSPVIVRVAQSKPDQRSRSHMGVCEYVSDGIWALGRIDSHVRVRDIRTLQDQTDAISTRIDLDMTDLIRSWTIEPDWQKKESAGLHLDMKYHVKNIRPPVNPSKELYSKYIETLYSQTPLSYFVKSTLSKTKTWFKALELETQNEHKSHKKEFTTALRSLVLDIRTIDDKFTKLELSELEMTKYSFLTENVSSKKQKMIQDGLKLREIQLQIIVLLEIMTLSDDSQVETPTLITPPEVEKPEKKPKKIGLVRRKVSSKKDASFIQKSSESFSSVMSVPVHIDILFDRLCIFQALEGLEQPTDKSSYSAGQDTKPHDRVLEFCLEVILPFYGNRLPSFIKSMVKKVRGMSAKRTAQAPSTAKQDESEAHASLSPTLAITKRPALSTSPTLSKKATRKASVKSLESNQKRQVDLIPSFKSIRDENIQAELAKAIKNVARPNRTATIESITKPLNKIKPDIQVAMTPIKKRIVTPTYLGPVTPVKRPKFDEVMSSPMSAIVTDEDA